MRLAETKILEQREIMEKVRRLNAGKQPLALLETYGCQQNENDTERLAGFLCGMGYGFTRDSREADLILFNTCAVRENAQHRAFGNVGALKGLKAARPGLIIGVCGCMPQQEHIAQQLQTSYRHVDMIFGTHALYKFPQLLLECMERRATVVDTENPDGYIAEGLPLHRTDSIRARVSVMYGCNNFCSYCIVPYVRGRERSRRAEDILPEVEALAAGGCKEVMLLGQNVNSYGHDTGDGVDFARLLGRIAEQTDIKRVRFMTSHPKDISDALIETMARYDVICKHLHLPVQAGSDKVLKLMNRRYTARKYLDIISAVKSAMPKITLTTDIIVGFPGETSRDFEETLDLLREVEFDNIFSFIYSKREGTPAASMADVLTPEEKKHNFDRLLETQTPISKRRNDALVGRRLEVLTEGASKSDANILSGRTEGNKIVNFAGESRPGEMAHVEITASKTWHLEGRV